MYSCHLFLISSASVSAAAAAAKSLQLCPTLQPHRWQPSRLPRPWDSPGKNTGVSCHFLLQGIFLEPDILECEVKWALGSITINKASGGDGIPVELFQILKDDAVKVLHSICQQIWKTQQWPQDWKRSVFIPFPKKISGSVVSDSLQPHKSQHARPPCPSPTPGVH